MKNLTINAGDTVRSAGGEDPLEQGMAAHSSILAWRIPRTERSLAGCTPGCRVGGVGERVTKRRTRLNTPTPTPTHTDK